MGDLIFLSARRATTAIPQIGDAAAVAESLLTQANALEARADALMAVEAGHAGMAAGKLRDGDALAAEHFEALRADAERTYLAMDEEVFRLRLQAAELQARCGRASVLADITSFSTGGPF